MALFDNPWANLTLGLASLKNPSLLGQVQQAQQQKLALQRQAEEDKLRRAMEDFAFQQKQREASGLQRAQSLISGDVVPGVSLPLEQRQQALAAALFQGGQPQMAISLVPGIAKYGAPKEAVNPDTGRPDYFMADDRGNMKWLGTGGTISKNEPYYTYVPTADGVAVLNARTGEISKPKQSIVRAQDDPVLQGKIAERKKIGTVTGEKKANVDIGYSALDAVDAALGLLEKGIYAGSWGPVQKTLVKAIPGTDKSTAIRTEEYISAIGDTVLPRLKEFGGNDSNEEMRYLQQIQAGNIEIEPQAMKNILLRIKANTLNRIRRLYSGEEAITPRPPEDRNKLLQDAYHKYGIK